MKKRTLKQQAKYARKVILERNKDFYNELMRRNYPDEETKRDTSADRVGLPQKAGRGKFGFSGATVGVKYGVAAIAVALVAVITLVVCLVVFLPGDSGLPIDPDTPIIEDPEKPGDGGSKHYLSENEVTAISDINAVNNDVGGIIFEIGELYNVFINKIYDSVSNDTLYYSIAITNELETIVIEVYTNIYYEIKNEPNDKYTSAKFNDLEVKYSETMTKEQEVLFRYNDIAFIEVGETIIYINYKELSAETESNFFDFIEKTIKKK